MDMTYKTFKYVKKVDYILIDTYSTSNFWFAFLTAQIGRLFSAKYIPILHGGMLPLRIKKSKLVSKMIFHNSYCNVAPSSFLQKSFIDAGFKNTRLIANSITLNDYTFQTKKFDYPRILWVRSFSEIYNPKLAIDVYYEIKKKYPESSLCMIGPKKDSSYDLCFEHSKKMQLDVIFTGGLSKKAWIEESKKYNVFINTTHFDNTPVSVIEAMALGFPIVSTNVGGIPYLVEHNKTALLVNDNDLQNMVLQIERLFNEADLPRKLTENGRNLVQNFDWEIVKKQWIELFK
jgi:glycosyltransferase involved in cell wall biosynthesis